MFNFFAKNNPCVAPALRRVLIVEPQPAIAAALGDLVRGLTGAEVWTATSAGKGLKLAGKVDPELIFCELKDEQADGPGFTRSLRRSDLACRKAPVVLTAADASASEILAGRDAGAHEVLRRPFVARELTRRLAAALEPRGWVEAMDYVGPDRRRFNSADYEGPPKRLADHAPPHSVRIAEALKIIASALAALERDPAQALRALRVQTTELDIAAAESGDARLTAANAELQGLLGAIAPGQGLDAAEARRRGAALLSYAGRAARVAA